MWTKKSDTSKASSSAQNNIWKTRSRGNSENNNNSENANDSSLNNSTSSPNKSLKEVMDEQRGEQMVQQAILKKLTKSEEDLEKAIQASLRESKVVENRYQPYNNNDNDNDDFDHLENKTSVTDLILQQLNAQLNGVRLSDSFEQDIQGGSSTAVANLRPVEQIISDEDLAKKLQREEEENEMNNKTNINSNLALGDSTDNDAVIAKLLQRQLDREYNAELKATEKMINKNSKICYNYDNFRLDDDSSSEYESETELVEVDGTFVAIEKEITAKSKNNQLNSSILSNSSASGPAVQFTGRQREFTASDDECPEVYEDLNRPAKLTGRQERFDEERQEWINKHDIIETGKNNALKLDSFPLQCQTGNMKGLSLSNKNFNALKVHAHQQKKISAKLHENKDTSIAEHAIDKRTRLILHKLVNAGTLEQINGVISIGKEAIVLHAKGGTITPMNQNSIQKPIPENIAIKIFKTQSEFKKRDKYIQDDFRFQERFRKVNARKQSYLWAEKEMRNLERLNRAHIASPEVVLIRKHVLIMRFIGSTTITGGSPDSAAPKLSEYLVKFSEGKKLACQVRALQQTIQIMKDMYQKAKLVHCDFSPYNLLWHENKVWVIDVAQAVETSNPRALEFLYRDCLTICKFFANKLKIREVPNPRKLFFEICQISTEGLEIPEEDYINYDPSGKENTAFLIKLDELRVRAHQRLVTRRGLDYVVAGESGGVA